MRATAADLAAALALRTALREMLLCNHDGRRPPPEVISVLNETADLARLSLQFTAEGAPASASTAPGIGGALGRLLAIVADAQHDGTWQRLKLCPADDCAWAYYDVSRNRSRRWCSMDVCGNRAKVHAYRERAAVDQDGGLA